MKRILKFMIVPLFSIYMSAQSEKLISTLETYHIETGKRNIVLQENNHFEAPNWSLDGSYFIINQNGLLYRVSLDGTSKKQIFINDLNQCNNDHGISPDGTQLVVSNNDEIEGSTSGTSRIYLVPISGGAPKLITPFSPSYWHGWSPDGKTLIYTAKRNNDFDIYSISTQGGEEIRLTSSKSLDDGPEYSHDGKHIYYNAMKSGKMEIWRMDANGENKIQLTKDRYSNWFAHPSPDGKYLVYISYLEDQGDRHPSMKNVALRLYDLQEKNSKTLCRFIGGQGTINVGSWSPNSKQFAFVSYEKIK